MTYHLGRGGSQLGQFTEAEIREGLSSGRFLGTDLAWTEGMADWKLVGEVFASPVSPADHSPGVAAPTFSSTPSPEFVQVPKATPSGLAITSLILGILSIVTCSGLAIGALAAIICGHISLSQISHSQGALSGRGKALTGTVLGYLSLVVTGLWIVFSTFTATQMLDKARTLQTLANGKQVTAICVTYASQNQGKLPDSLDQLSPDYLSSAEIQRLTVDSKGDPFFEYLGKGKTLQDPEDTIILLGIHVAGDGRRTVGRLNGSAEVEAYSPQRLVDPAR